jgi:hypothetical protein
VIACALAAAGGERDHTEGCEGVGRRRRRPNPPPERDERDLVIA